MEYLPKVLFVDLTKKLVKKVTLGKEVVVKLLGGRGINIATLLGLTRENLSELDPFSPDNPIVIGTGPLVGTIFPASCRARIASLSPLTGIIGDSSFGGHWAPELRYAGFDHIVITGRSESPVYIWINDDDVEIRSAENVWGKDIWETDRILKEETDKDAKVLAIGPAGENLVRYACVVSNVHNYAGRTGMGAVFGSKKLKAIVVRGTKGVKVAHPKEFYELCRELYGKIKEHPRYEILSTQGATRLSIIMYEDGRQPVKNFQANFIEGGENILTPEFLKLAVKHKSCFSCPIGCTYVFLSQREGEAVFGQHFPENPITEALKVGMTDLASLIKVYVLVGKYGIDIDSSMTTIAFAMECFEKGILKRDQVGYDLTWGNSDAVISLIEEIAYRKGFGDMLAEGVMRLSSRLGKETEEFAMHIKGEELLPELRSLTGSTLAHAVSSRGGDHVRTQCFVAEYGVPPDYSERVLGDRDATNPLSKNSRAKAIMVRYFEDLIAVSDSLGICSFLVSGVPMVELEEISKALYLALDIEISKEELLKAGERVINLERIFNEQRGVTRKEDTLPKRLFEPLPEGPYKGQRLTEKELEDMLTEYYKLRGWDTDTGRVSKEKIKELGLDNLIIGAL
ncbi:MAG: aldehyde ferredoxin oxidoreductase family protein [Candidatus Korarchaeota archaeon]|nr:aldehyde ferredoxin oxidoreductase family protein [Candidatus Korarchaeota archaeon]